MQRSSRYVKGTNVIDLVKLVKSLQSKGPLPSLSGPGAALLAERLLPSAWYRLEPFVELLQTVDGLLLRGDEARAMELGAAGGLAALQGSSRLYLQPNDPVATVLAMRHAWRARHDFGELVATTERERSVRFTLTLYDDIGMAHALTTAGWGVAAARAAGARHASVEVLARPWRGDASFCYRIHF